MKKKDKKVYVFSKEQIEQFVVLWRDASSPGDVAKAMDIPLSVASSLATRLRKKGVELQKFRRVSPVDTEALNKILKS